MSTLNNDILGAKFGTKNRAELILRTDKIKNAVLLAALYRVPKKFLLNLQKNYEEIIRNLNQQP